MNILLGTFIVSNVAFVFLFFKKQNYGMFTFLHLITTMAESGSTEEQTEFFILNSQKGAKASWWRNCFARLSNHLQEHCGEVGTTEADFPMRMEFDPISFETVLLNAFLGLHCMFNCCFRSWCVSWQSAHLTRFYHIKLVGQSSWFAYTSAFLDETQCPGIGHNRRELWYLDQRTALWETPRSTL